LTSLSEPSRGTFARKVGVELNRAERYRVFVSLTVLDLELATAVAGEKASEILQDIMSRVKDAVRACDYVELLDDHCLAVLLPETPRQGAEVAARRLTDLVKVRFSESTGRQIEEVIPVEIASFPDTAGARTMAGFLEELAEKSRN